MGQEAAVCQTRHLFGFWDMLWGASEATGWGGDTVLAFKGKRVGIPGFVML